MIGKIFYIFLKAIRSSKIITSIVWGIKIKEYCHETFWDLTTLVIKKEMSNRNDKFDLITFNPPYVPTTNNLGNNNYPNIRFSGSDGLKTTKEFLKDAKNYLSTTGEILLGINTFYVPQRSCLDIIYNTGYKLKKITYMKFNTSVVFRLSIV